MFELSDIPHITRTVNRDPVIWDTRSGVFVAKDESFGWHLEPVVLVSPRTGESIRFDSLDICLSINKKEVHSWILAGRDHGYKLVIIAKDEEN